MMCLIIESLLFILSKLLYIRDLYWKWLVSFEILLFVVMLLYCF